MRVKFGNKIFESNEIIHPGGIDKSLFVKTPNGTYEVMYSNSVLAAEALNKVFSNGYIDFSLQKYTNQSTLLG